MAVNLASKYATKVDERFSRESLSDSALNHDYTFQGVTTVNVYSFPTAAMNNYTRSGANRYGTPAELQDSVQELTVTRDRAFTATIDKGNRIQSQMVRSAGTFLSRQIREAVVPEYDTYVFLKLAQAASANGTSHNDATTPTKTNAYQLFLNAQEVLGNANVPDSGRVCFASYGFANLLKQDPAFMIASPKSRETTARGTMGEVDGVRVVKVPAARLPAGCSFILTHPLAATGVKQLQEFKIHQDPPGINGWLIEGRVIYDCFVLDSKKDAVFYHGTALL